MSTEEIKKLLVDFSSSDVPFHSIAWAEALSPESALNCIAYLKHIASQPELGIPEAGEELFKILCNNCHGPDPKVKLADRNIQDFTSPQWQRDVDDHDIFMSISKGTHVENVIMPSYDDNLTLTNIWDLVAYIRTLKDYSQPIEDGAE